MEDVLYANPPSFTLIWKAFVLKSVIGWQGLGLWCVTVLPFQEQLLAILTHIAELRTCGELYANCFPLCIQFTYHILKIRFNTSVTNVSAFHHVLFVYFQTASLNMRFYTFHFCNFRVCLYPCGLYFRNCSLGLHHNTVRGHVRLEECSAGEVSPVKEENSAGLTQQQNTKSRMIGNKMVFLRSARSKVQSEVRNMSPM